MSDPQRSGDGSRIALVAMLAALALALFLMFAGRMTAPRAAPAGQGTAMETHDALAVGKSAPGNGPHRQTVDEVTGLTWCHATEDPASCFPKVCDGGKKKALVFVGTSWCGWCKKFKRETLANPRVQARLKDVGLVYVDGDKAPRMATKLGANGYPHQVIMDADCSTKLGENPGFVNATQFLSFLEHHGL